jgi:hypothetical protein
MLVSGEIFFAFSQFFYFLLLCVRSLSGNLVAALPKSSFIDQNRFSIEASGSLYFFTSYF